MYWDQRGAGKSYSRAISASSITVERFICDLDELTDAVCERLGKSEVAIFGHSWGSVLGVLYAARFPEKVAAYVDSGQIGDRPAAESASYEWTLAEARRQGNRRAVSKLRAIGPPPHGADAVFTERTWSMRLSGGMRPQAVWKMVRPLLGGHESSIIELPSAWRGAHFTMNATWPEVSRLNLIELAPALQMPVFFLLGCQDRWIPPETSVAYFDALTAPTKKLVWFEHSGHEPFVESTASSTPPWLTWSGRRSCRTRWHRNRDGRRARHRPSTPRSRRCGGYRPRGGRPSHNRRICSMRRDHSGQPDTRAESICNCSS